MNRKTDRYFEFDWITILLFLLLVAFGWVNIVSASHTGTIDSYFNLTEAYGKQLVFILLTFILIVLILSTDSKFYERFSSLLYLISILSLVGLFLFGKNVNGATSWYAIGNITLQPSEFAKAATALALSKYVSDLNTDLKQLKYILNCVLIISIPAILVLLQNDAGSTIIFASLFLILFREGLPRLYVITILILILISVLALKFGAVLTSVGFTLVIVIQYFLTKKKKNNFRYFISIIGSILIAFSTQFFYKNILQKHQQERISLWLRLEKDPETLKQIKKTIAYNLNESEKAISSGGLTGKGFLQGTRTKGKFVPEQHTDYIFSTVGEEWGFLGSFAVLVVFILLLLRIIYLAEKQKKQFSRVYGYAVAAILFTHFTINIGMVMGLLPTIGIPLPFFSYGGSALWGFTILLFIFIKLDSNKINQW